jgi:hypothetical protein
VGGGMAALGGGNLQDVLKGAAMGYIGGTVAPSISSYMPGAAGSLLNQGLTGAALGTGFGLASGMSAKDALKAGAIGGVTAAGVGYGQQKGYLPGGQAAGSRTTAPADAAADGSNLSLAPIEGTGGVGTASENLTPVMRQDALTGQQFSVGVDGKEYLVYKDAAGNNQYVRADPVNPTQPMAPRVAQASPVALSGNIMGAPLSVEGLGQQTASTYYTGGGQSPDAISMRNAPFDTTGNLGQQTANTYYTGGGQSPSAVSMQDASLGVEIGGPRYGGPAPVEDRSSYSLGARGEQVLGPVKDFYNENFAPSRPAIQQQNQEAILAGTRARAQYIQAAKAEGIVPTSAGADAAYQTAYEASAPGFFAKYAPMAAAGLGATYLAGGFETPIEPGDNAPVYDPAYTGTDYMRDNPQAFSGSLYNYQSQGAGAYDPTRATLYAGGQGAAAPGVVTPTGIMQAQYLPEYGRRIRQQRYYSPFIGTAEPVMAAKGGMITAEPVYMAGGGMFSKAVSRIDQAVKQQAAAAEEEAIRKTGSKFAGPRPPPPANMERWLEGGMSLPPAQPAMQSVSPSQPMVQPVSPSQPMVQPVSPTQQRYDPYRATIYAGNQGTASPGVVLPTGILQAQYSPNYGRRRMRPVRAADGGSITEFPRKSGPINGPGTGTSDDIPAMLSDGEFVFTARAVRNAGNGSRRKGAARMYKLMKSLEKGGMVKG